jgi:predicted Zn-dependent peptidase
MYAFNRMLEEMAKDEIISVSSMGTLEALEKITPNSIYQEYEKLISEEMARIYVIGDITQEEVIDIFKTFPFKVNHLTLEASSMEEKHVTKVKEVIETQNINQAQLMMGFRTNVNALDELYIPMSVFNMMFGGMVSSDLFRVVREENSLAYNVSSSIFFSNRLLVVNAGIDSKNYQLTTDLVIKELERYKNGDIDANLMQVAKDNLISGLQETDDNDFSYLMFVIKNSLLKNYTVEDVIKLINQVTVEEVHQASQMIELDTIYCLRGEDHE